MRAYCRIVIVAAFLVTASLVTRDLRAQTTNLRVLHMQQTQTTAQLNFPTFLAMYHVLDGAKSPVEALSLTGTITLTNFNPHFSEVLWVLAYWKGECPAQDLALADATIFWSDIVKNPSQSDSKFDVNLDFPHPLPISGCIGLYYGGGPLVQGKVRMSADLNLTYRPVKVPSQDSIIDLSGEYCFGQDWGCQNATKIAREAFAVPISIPQAGHLLELYGNISDSTFDGTEDFGPPPTGESWGAVNDFYLLPGGCGVFAENLNGQGFPNPALLSTLHSWLPSDALHLASLPLVDRVSPEGTSKATLQGIVENIFSVPVKVNAGDCVLAIYGRTGNGASDNETQVHALLAP